MNEVPTAPDELISRHFDGPLSSDDHQRLTDAILTDSAARAEFVAAARLHAGLEALAPPTVVRKSKADWWRTICGGAAAALILMGLVWSFKSSRDAEVSIDLHDIETISVGPPKKGTPTQMTRRVVRTPAAGLDEQEISDSGKLLSTFYVTETPHGKTVPEALALLESMIKNYNVRGRPELDELKFEAGESKDPEVADPVIFATQPAPVTIGSYLQICASYREVSQKPQGIMYRGYLESQSANSVTIQDRDFWFFGFHKSLNKEAWIQDSKTALRQELGIRFGMDETASYDDKNDVLRCRAKGWKLNLVEARRHLLNRTESFQYMLTNFLVRVPQNLIPPSFDRASGVVLNQSKFEEFTNLLRKDTTVEWISPGGKIQVKHKQMGDFMMGQRPNHPRGEFWCRQTAWAGPVGEFIRIEGKVVVAEHEMLPIAAMDPLEIGQVSLEYELWLPDGYTGLFLLDDVSPDGFVMMIGLTAKRDFAISR